MNNVIPNTYFPSVDSSEEESSKKNTSSKNIALTIFGNRFNSSQTAYEYLSEFLLVFNSSKSNDKVNYYSTNSFTISSETAYYHPKTRLGLKFFSFFSQSKLETRHPVHQKEFLNALELIKSKMDSYISDEEKNNLVQTLQSLLYGFMGISEKNRTWCTNNFLPITPSLLGREVTWTHTTENFDTWHDANKNFEVTKHNFMARGGEVLFLQLGYLFSNIETHQQFIKDVVSNNPIYDHLEFDLGKLKNKLENQLINLLKIETNPIENIANFIDKTLQDYEINNPQRAAHFAQIPKCYVFEAFLFANELTILLNGNISKLEKIEFLQILCVMQVLRSIMARSCQLDTTLPKTPNFHGNYAWIVCSPTATSSDPIRKHAEGSFQKNEEIIYRVLRAEGKKHEITERNYAQIDSHSLAVFKKMAKAIGLVIPVTGGHQRFVLNANLTRLFVYTLIPTGQRIQINEFLSRIQAHFSISFYGDQLQEAISWQYEKISEPTTDIKLTWFEESLRQSGLLIELSDSISIVKNP